MNRYLNWVTDKSDKRRGFSVIKSKVQKKKMCEGREFQSNSMGQKRRRVTRLVAGYLSGNGSQTVKG